MISPPILYSLHLRNHVLNLQLTVLWKRNVHCRIHNSSRNVSVLYHIVTFPLCTKPVLKLYYHGLHFPRRFPNRNFVVIFWSIQCVLHSQLSSFTPKCVARSNQSVSPPHFLKTSFNISPHLRLGLTDWIFPSGVTHKNPVWILPLPQTCCTPCSSQFSWLNHSNNVLWKAIQLSLMKFIPLPCYLDSLETNITFR